MKIQYLGFLPAIIALLFLLKSVYDVAQEDETYRQGLLLVLFCLSIGLVIYKGFMWGISGL